LQSGVTITVPLREVEGYERPAPEPQRPGSGGCGKPNCRHRQHAQAEAPTEAPTEAPVSHDALN
jgi:hypothetical protein